MCMCICLDVHACICDGLNQRALVYSSVNVRKFCECASVSVHVYVPCMRMYFFYVYMYIVNCAYNPPRPQAQVYWGFPQVKFGTTRFLRSFAPPPPPPPRPPFILPVFSAPLPPPTPLCPPPPPPPLFHPSAAPPCPPPSHFCIHSALSHYRNKSMSSVTVLVSASRGGRRGVKIVFIYIYIFLFILYRY